MRKAYINLPLESEEEAKLLIKLLSTFDYKNFSFREIAMLGEIETYLKERLES